LAGEGQAALKKFGGKSKKEPKRGAGPGLESNFGM
jgi:hypothetical protein